MSAEIPVKRARVEGDGAEAKEATEDLNVKEKQEEKQEEKMATPALYVKRLSEAATLPVRASAGAAGYDLFW